MTIRPLIIGATAVGAFAVGSLCPPCGGGARAAAAQTSAAASPAIDTATARLRISGMTCGSCATTARLALRRVRGVYDATVSYDSASAVVHFDPAQTQPPVFIAELERLTGYRATVVVPDSARAARP